MMQQRNVHYAWVICFACALAFFCTCGLTLNVFNVYAPFIMQAREFTKTQISALQSVRYPFQMAAILLVGKIYAKTGFRNGMLLAGLFCAAGFAVYGLAESFPVYLAGSCLAGFGYGLGAMVPIAMLLNRWFAVKRAMAVSLVSMASGLATIGIPSLITAVIRSAGLKNAFLLQAAVMAVLILICRQLIRDTPEECSLTAYGTEWVDRMEKPTPPDGAASAEKSENGRAAVEAAAAPQPEKKKKLGRWWIVLYIMVILSSGFNGAGYASLSMLSSTAGYSSELVALALSIAGACLMAGKFVFGAMSTKSGLYKASMIFSLCCVLASVLCCFVTAGAWVMLIACGFYAFSISMISVSLVAWVDDWADRSEHDMRVQRFQLIFSIGSLPMGLLPGIMADHLGGTYIPFYAFAGVLSAIVLVIVRQTYRRLENGPQASSLITGTVPMTGQKKRPRG